MNLLGLALMVASVVSHRLQVLDDVMIMENGADFTERNTQVEDMQAGDDQVHDGSTKEFEKLREAKEEKKFFEQQNEDRNGPAQTDSRAAANVSGNATVALAATYKPGDAVQVEISPGEWVDGKVRDTEAVLVRFEPDYHHPVMEKYAVLKKYAGKSGLGKFRQHQWTTRVLDYLPDDYGPENYSDFDDESVRFGGHKMMGSQMVGGLGRGNYGRCKVPGCKQCSSPSSDVCQQCKDGYMANPEKTQCLECKVSNCEECAGDQQTCGTCKYGYKKISETECQCDGSLKAGDKFRGQRCDSDGTWKEMCLTEDENDPDGTWMTVDSCPSEECVSIGHHACEVATDTFGYCDGCCNGCEEGMAVEVLRQNRESKSLMWVMGVVKTVGGVTVKYKKGDKKRTTTFDPSSGKDNPGAMQIRKKNE